MEVEKKSLKGRKRFWTYLAKLTTAPKTDSFIICSIKQIIGHAKIH